ncbi:LytR/AlgR family response regulator transcription factor [Hyphococcus sp.]|uniref:LytR/AlgR family response regulator transcription factor n=1 Tax=Hyphococcus sp. TaxID=2038636 RepID=UPI002086B4AC|nr:MAG: DNA-binding response regulator [Marinicaulis sp.]
MEIHAQDIVAIVVDDEPIIADDLASLINAREHWSATAFNSLADARQAIRRRRIDVCFLDIEMPGENGLVAAREIAGELGDVKIIFVTAFQKYATAAFRVNAVDYLVKPITKDLLAEACARVETAAGAASVKPVDLSALPARNNADEPRIAIQIGTRVAYVLVSAVVYAKAAGNYVEVVADDKTHITRVKFSRFAEEITNTGLIQTHRSYVVNPAHVKAAQFSSGCIVQLELTNGAAIPVSEKFRDSVGRHFQHIGIGQA